MLINVFNERALRHLRCRGAMCAQFHNFARVMPKTTVLSSECVKSFAAKVGFTACGICPAAPVEQQVADLMDRYVSEGRNADMDYLARNRELRFNPSKLVPGTKTIVSVALNYYPGEKMHDNGYTLSYYAYGKDYHTVVKKRLFEMYRLIRESLGADGGALSGRAFCDTAPVPERYWAYRAGIGFPGKNTLLVIPGAGSYFFLGELFLNLEADAYDEPIGNRCGSCTRCLDACPTHALYEPYRMDARRCLSYLTIENRGSIPPEAAKAMETCIYGCDRCQRACPYNKAAKPTDVDDFRPDARLLGMTPEDWKNLTEEQYCELFRASAVKRAKYSGLMRNIRAVGQGGEEK